MVTLRKANAWLSWLLEIAMLAVFIYWGFRTGDSLWLKLGLGIGVPLAVFVLWGLLLSPMAGEHISGVTGTIVSLVLFYIAALMLFQVKQPVLGAIMAIAAAVNRTLAVIWKQ